MSKHSKAGLSHLAAAFFAVAFLACGDPGAGGDGGTGGGTGGGASTGGGTGGGSTTGGGGGSLTGGGGGSLTGGGGGSTVGGGGGSTVGGGGGSTVGGGGGSTVGGGGGSTVGGGGGSTVGGGGGSTVGGGGGSTGGGGGTIDAGTIPAVLATAPLNGAVNVAAIVTPSVAFTEAMNPASLTTNSFALTSGNPSVPVAGFVSYATEQAVFWPTANLSSSTLYTATVTTAAVSAPGVALPSNYVWTFTTGVSPTSGLPVNLGTAGNFVILAKAGISTVPTSAITGNLGVSPAAATYITGFSLSADATNVFSRSSQVTGQLFAANYAVPTPSNLTTAVGDMQTAFTDAAGRAPTVTELGTGNIGGMTLTAGVYKWGTSLRVPSDVTLTGSATDVFIFQVAQNLIVSSTARVVLAGGVLPKNVFWQVSGLADFGTTSHLEGVVLSQTAITLRTGASINGRLLAQTAVNIAGSTVVQPAP